MSRYFPLFIDLEGKKILVVGAGHIAERRILTLLSFGAKLTVIAPEATEKIKKLAEEGAIRWQEKCWDAETENELEGSLLVLSATGDTSVNEAVFSACKRRAIPVNCADDRTRCDFYFPGIAEGGGVTAGITAGGTNHRLAREATEKVRELLIKM